MKQLKNAPLHQVILTLFWSKNKKRVLSKYIELGFDWSQAYKTAKTWK